MRLLRLLYTLPLRIRSLFRRDQVEQELDDEIRDHFNAGSKPTSREA